MEFPVNKMQFLKLYFDYLGWNEQENVVFIENPLLDEFHPLTLIRTLGKVMVEYYPNGFNLTKENYSSELSNHEIMKLLYEKDVKYHEKQYFIMYANQKIELPSMEGLMVKSLSMSQKLIFGRFKAQCSKEDLEKAGIGLENDEVYGVFHQNELLALGSLWFLGKDIADLHVLTLPKYRSIGLGKLLLGLLVNRSIQLNRVPIVQGEVDNIITNKIISSLGFIEVISIFEITKDQE